MSEDKKNDFSKLLEADSFKIPQAGETVKGVVVTASKSEVRLDIDGVLIGVVRGPELYEEADEYANLKPGDEVEATVIEEENENGELELSFRFAGQQKAWTNLYDAFENKKTIKVRILDANKGGLLARYMQIQGFLPVSQLAPDNYPRVSGGDKGKILEKLKSFVGRDFEVQVITLDEKEDKIIFSEKNIWSERQKDVIAKYKVGTKVEGGVTAVTDFGVFISFGDNMEGLIHISELAWQRIDSPSDLYKVGDKIEAEVISLEDSKIFLSAKKLLKDPWEMASDKYKTGDIVKGKILKVNAFGLFVKLDRDIHGLAHISQLGLAPDQKIHEVFKSREERNFEIMQIEAKEHRLGLKLVDGDGKSMKETKKDTKDKKDELKKKQKKDEGREDAKDTNDKSGKDVKKTEKDKKDELKKEDKKDEDVDKKKKEKEKSEK
jgi:small subunit ribosomal protein S1